MKRMRIRYVLLLLLGILCLHSFAQVPMAISYPEGLSGMAVRSVYQDSHGFIWVGTTDGLSRYDGRNVIVYRHIPLDSLSLSANWINDITEDAHGLIWIATRKGLCTYERGTGVFRKRGCQVNGAAAGYIAAVASEGSNVYASMNGHGVLVFRNGMDSCLNVPLLTGEKLEFNYKVIALAEDGAGKLWALSSEHGLCLFDKKKGVFRIYDVGAAMATCLEAENGIVWVGDASGVTEYNALEHKSRRLYTKKTQRHAGERVTGIKQDKDKNLWLAVNYAGIFMLENLSGALKEVVATEPFTKGTESMYCLERDKDGRMWAGSSKEGVFLFDPHRNNFGTYIYRKIAGGEYSRYHLFSLAEDKNGTVWVGTDGNGLGRWNKPEGKFDVYIPQPGVHGKLGGNAICDIAIEESGDVWLATYANGVSRYNSVSRDFTQFECADPSRTGTANSVFSVAVTKGNVVWAATLKNNMGSGALFRFNRSGKRFEVFDSSLSDLLVLKILSSGTLVGGNSHEIIMIDTSEAKKHNRFEAGDVVRAIAEAGDGKLWVGTEERGLLVLDTRSGKVVKEFTTRNGLCSNAVLSILKDDDGRLWMGTNFGLSCFTPGKESFENYFVEDGLPANQFSFHAALRLSDGRMAFGTVRGLVLFDPRTIRTAGKPAAPVVAAIRVEGKSLCGSFATWKYADEGHIRYVEMPFESANLALDFTSPEFTYANQLRYSYFLEGWDKNWVDAGKMQTITYSNLNEGKYKLRIRARTVSGGVGPEMPPLTIRVLPPWYRTWWAFLVCFLIGITALYFFVSHRIRQRKLLYEVNIAKLTAANEKAEKEKQQARFAAEKAENEKDKVLMETERQLNERRKDFFTNISHEFRTPLTLIVNPAKTLQYTNDPNIRKEMLNTIYLNSKRLLSLVDQLLLFNRSESGFDKLKVAEQDMGLICKEVFRCFVNQAIAKGVLFTLECPETALPVYVDKMKMEIILFNLLSNAVKFTPPGGSVTLRIEQTESEYHIGVSDSGEGIPQYLAGKLFEKFAQPAHNAGKVGFGVGLYLAKNFANAHKGTLQFESVAGEGTTFYLTLKKGKEHFNLDEFADETVGCGSIVPELFIVEETETTSSQAQKGKPIEKLAASMNTILIIDDDNQMLRYLSDVFSENYHLLQAMDGTAGLEMALKHAPDLIISDIHMGGLSGIDLCRTIKETSEIANIPVVLLTGNQSDALRLEGVEGGADDYMIKPFDVGLLKARVASIIKGRKGLQQYFINEVTLQNNSLKVSEEFRQFLEVCIEVVGRHLDDDTFAIPDFAREMNMSHSTLYNRIKALSGLSINAFIRHLRLRKAAEMLVKTNMKINEVAYNTGFNHLPYFRKCFQQLFGMPPSEYVKKYRGRLGDNFSINKDSFS